MASPRLTFGLALVVVLLNGWCWFFERKQETTDEHRLEERRILHLHANEVTRLKLRRDAWTSALVERMDASTFTRIEPSSGVIDSAAVAELLSAFEFEERRAELSGHGGDAQRLYDEGLNPPQLTLTLTLADQRELEIAFGKATPTADGVYLHVQNEERVLVVDAGLYERSNRLLDQLVESPPPAKSE